MIWMLIVGGVIGWLAGMIMGRDIPGGVIGNIVAGFIGAWLGENLLGDFGPTMGSFYIVPALLGSIILIAIVTFVMQQSNRSN